MEDSILTTVKKSLGIAEEYEQFDLDVLVHINTVLNILTDLGVGPAEGFTITDKTATWHDFVPDARRLESVKSYVCLRVRLLFDPPTSSSATDAFQRQIDELTWRINVVADS